MPRTKSQTGDLTGRKSAQLQKEHAEELAKRAQEMGMINQAQEIVDEQGVFDPATGEQVDGPDLTEALESTPGIEYASEEDEIIDATDQEVHPTIPPVGSDEVVEQPQPIHVDGGFRVVRVNTDLEDVTIGQGTNYNFREGRRYRVPIHVANHLEEKGYVWH